MIIVSKPKISCNIVWTQKKDIVHGCSRSRGKLTKDETEQKEEREQNKSSQRLKRRQMKQGETEGRKHSR